MPKYEVKNVKTFRGLEGQGFNCTLYRDGKRVAQVDDAAHGGCLDWHWLDYDQSREEVTITAHDGHEFTRRCTPEEKIFIEHVRENSDATFEPEDMFVYELVNKFLETRQFKSWCRSKTVFRLKGDKAGEWRTINVKFSDPRIKPHLVEKHGDQLEEILNERF